MKLYYPPVEYVTCGCCGGELDGNRDCRNYCTDTDCDCPVAKSKRKHRHEVSRMYILTLTHCDGQVSHVTGNEIKVVANRLTVYDNLSDGKVVEYIYDIGFDYKHPECTITSFELVWNN